MERVWATDNLVSGLRIRMTSVELKEHLTARSVYHAKRREEKKEHLPKLKEAAKQIKAQASVSAQVVNTFNKGDSYNFQADDAVASLERDIENHNNKSVAFAFLANHLFDCDYCLQRSDMVELEILKAF